MRLGLEVKRPGILWGLLLCLMLVGLLFLPLGRSHVGAEGSVGLNIIGDTSRRPLVEWRTGKTAGLYRRTFFQVYANAGESILMGSSAVKVGSGDIALWTPGRSFNSQTDPAALPAPDFLCSVSQKNNGQLDTRAKEVAGPQPNPSGYKPCTYTAASTGIHWVAFYGPDGPNGNNDGNAGTIAAPEIGNAQRSGVSMWDITVRDSSGATRNGRVFVDYLAMISGNNGVTYRLYSTVYALTKDGFIYKMELRGLDPNGFILFGNDVGFLDPDGVTPLYHDAVCHDNSLTEPADGHVLRSPATARLFFNQPADDLPAAIRAKPTLPSVSNISFEGSAGDNDAIYSAGGVFYYRGNVGGIAEITISRDGVDFDPTKLANRSLRSPSAMGVNTIVWDGLDNAGQPFPVGKDYPLKVHMHAGEYHFPIMDAENSPLGGPTITMLNPPGGVCPFNPNCHTAFYDDRGYYVTTPPGTMVGTPGSTLPGDSNSTNPPTINHSDPINGFDTSTTQRSFGATDGNGFGNWKGLDLWTYFPSTIIVEKLDVVPVLAYDLNIVKSHKGAFEVKSGGGAYKLSVSNVGNQTITGEVVVTDDLPVGLTAASASGSGWECSISGDRKSVVCKHPNSSGLAADASLPDITVSVNISGSANPVTSNTATVANASDVFAANNQFTDIADVYNPTAVELVSFTAYEKDRVALLEWETATERSLVGFNVYRAEELSGLRQQVNTSMIACQDPGGMGGRVYSFMDNRVEPGKTYYYWLEFLKGGEGELSDPAQVTILRSYFLPVTWR